MWYSEYRLLCVRQRAVHGHEPRASHEVIENACLFASSKSRRPGGAVHTPRLYILRVGQKSVLKSRWSCLPCGLAPYDAGTRGDGAARILELGRGEERGRGIDPPHTPHAVSAPHDSMLLNQREPADIRLAVEEIMILRSTNTGVVSIGFPAGSDASSMILHHRRI